MKAFVSMWSKFALSPTLSDRKLPVDFHRFLAITLKKALIRTVREWKGSIICLNCKTMIFLTHDCFIFNYFRAAWRMRLIARVNIGVRTFYLVNATREFRKQSYYVLVFASSRTSRCFEVSETCP